MEIRPARPADVAALVDIDGTIESARYLHLERSGDALDLAWRLEERPLREKLIAANPLDDDRRFALKQIAGGADEGIATVAEHDGALIALVLAQPDPARGTLRMLDLRVDYDFRRQGLATGLVFSLVSAARDAGLRAVAAETLTSNIPAAHLLLRCGFEVAGIDAKRVTNHDLVKESVTLFWYAALD